MNEHQIKVFKEEIKEHIGVVMQKVVNGKIDSFRKEQDEVNKYQNKTLEIIQVDVKSLKEFREITKPVVSAYEKNTNFKIVLKAILGWVVLVGAAISAFLFLEKKL